MASGAKAKTHGSGGPTTAAAKAAASPATPAGSVATAAALGRKAAAPGTGMDECALMQRAYHVVVGLSWGTLPPLLQQRWTQLHCDQQVLNILG